MQLIGSLCLSAFRFAAASLRTADPAVSLLCTSAPYAQRGFPYPRPGGGQQWFEGVLRPSLLPDPLHSDDVACRNLAPTLPLARNTRHVLVTVLHQLLRDHNVAGTAVRKTE